jgi:hypothetical protein
MNRFAVAFMVLGLIAAYGWLAVVALLLLVIGYLLLALYGCLCDDAESAAALKEAQEQLRHAEERIEALRRTLASVGRSHASQTHRSDAQSPYRRVGLAEDCPDFVLKAVQKAYRANLHPDLKPAAQKSEAEKRFKQAEAAFEEIRRLRGL